MADVGDTFVEGSDTELGSHTPTGPNAGSGWTEDENTMTAPDGPIVDAANDIAKIDNGAEARVLMSIQADPTVADYDIKWTMVAITGGSDRPQFAISRRTDNNNYYSAGLRGEAIIGDENDLEIWKNVANTQTNLGTFNGAFANGTILEFKVSGTTQKLFEGVDERIGTTDTDLTSAGTRGLGWGDAWPNGGGSDADDGWEIDDLVITEAAAAAIVIPSLVMAPYLPT